MTLKQAKKWVRLQNQAQHWARGEQHLLFRIRSKPAPLEQPCTNLQYCTNRLFVILSNHNTLREREKTRRDRASITGWLFSGEIQIEMPLPSPPPILSHICLPNSTSLIDWVFRVLSHAVYYSSAAGRLDWIHRQNSHLKFLRQRCLFYKQAGCSSDPSVPEGALVCVWEHSPDMKTQTCHKLCILEYACGRKRPIWTCNVCFI